MVVKKDGRREPFDRGKILSGLLRACEKRPISTSQLERIADEVEKEVQESLDRELPTSEIGRLI
ncbi:ATP cone domain-containing protein, partial [Escherichia coli]|nr:ATP cone domain-containing protein [Escherichia coli]